MSAPKPMTPPPALVEKVARAMDIDLGDLRIGAYVAGGRRSLLEIVHIPLGIVVKAPEDDPLSYRERYDLMMREIQATAALAVVMPALEAATNLAALWQAQKIAGVSRADRNAAIEDSRTGMIEALRALGMMEGSAGRDGDDVASP